MSDSSEGNSSGPAPASFEIKSSQLPLVALMLKTNDLAWLLADLTRQFGAGGESPDFFDNDPLLIDCSQLRPDMPAPDLAPLLAVLRTCRLVPLALRGGNAAWLASARAMGLVEAPLDTPRATPRATPRVRPVATEIQEQEGVREPAPKTQGLTTVVVDKPLRSGQKIYARGADLVVLAMVNAGAEVIADGHIHVYAPLRGRALAGARGTTEARIFALALEAELLSIAGIYRTSENPLPPEVAGRPTQVRLVNDQEGEKLVMTAMS